MWLLVIRIDLRLVSLSEAYATDHFSPSSSVFCWRLRTSSFSRSCLPSTVLFQDLFFQVYFSVAVFPTALWCPLYLVPAWRCCRHCCWTFVKGEFNLFFSVTLQHGFFAYSLHSSKFLLPILSMSVHNPSLDLLIETFSLPLICSVWLLLLLLFYPERMSRDFTN